MSNCQNSFSMAKMPAVLRLLRSIFFMALAGVNALFAQDKSGFCIDLFVRIAILSRIERMGLINHKKRVVTTIVR